MEFKRHFTEADLERLFDGFTLPEDFLFGVANAAFQVEGGFNGPGEPLNNWVEGERSGRYAVSGEAVRFWTDYPEQLEMAKGLGLNGFRISIEWARIQPLTSVKHGVVPPFDDAAIEAYSDMIAAIRDSGMEPVVTLHHFTHPFWLGLDYWLDDDRLDLFDRYVEEVTGRLNALLVEKHSQDPLRLYVTINEPNGLAPLFYTLRYFPHRKAGLARTAHALGNLVAAHCLAYDTIHRVYRDRGWDRPMVSYNTIHLSVYHLDKMVTDLLLARRNGVERGDLPEYLVSGKQAWDQAVSDTPEVIGAARPYRWFESAMDRASARYFTCERLARGIDAIYRSPVADKLDYLATDYYDPFIRNMLKLPSFQDMREARFLPNQELWEQVLNPRGLYHFIKGELVNADGLPLYVLESGMCYRERKGRVEQRYDAATRDVFLQSYIYEVMRAIADGMPVRGFFQWTLVDNYEWGSYEPRFGLYTVDRSRTPVKISSVDAWGVNAGGAFGELIAAVRSRDLDRIKRAFTRDDW